MWPTIVLVLLPTLLLPTPSPSPLLGSAAAPPQCRSCCEPRLAPLAMSENHNIIPNAGGGGGGGWLGRLRGAGVALATAVVLAVPRGPAQAAELAGPAAESQAPDVAKLIAEPAFLGFRRRKNLAPPLVRGPPRRNEIDMDRIVSKKTARRFTERSFIFSDELTSKNELTEELDELDETAASNQLQKAASAVISTGGAVGLVYVSVKGLTSIERWMKQQELDDIAAEKELTGQYISVDASDIDTAIDPTTGKNLTITKSAAKANATSLSGQESEEEEPAEVPWLLRVLGLGDAKPASGGEEDFWTPVAASVPRNDGDGSGGAAGGAAGDADGAGEGEGGEGEGSEGDDSSDLDGLDDLLG